MLTSTEDFKGKIKEIKPKFIKYLEDYNTELTKESSRNTVFSDAIYLANHPELQIDFFGVLSGKIAMEQYKVKLIEHIEIKKTSMLLMQYLNPVQINILIIWNVFVNFFTKTTILQGSGFSLSLTYLNTYPANRASAYVLEIAFHIFATGFGVVHFFSFNA